MLICGTHNTHIHTLHAYTIIRTYILTPHTHKHTQTHTYTDTHMCLEEELKQARDDNKDIIKTHTHTHKHQQKFISSFRVKSQGNNKSRGKVNVIKRSK